MRQLFQDQHFTSESRLDEIVAGNGFQKDLQRDLDLVAGVERFVDRADRTHPEHVSDLKFVEPPPSHQVTSQTGNSIAAYAGTAI